MRKGIVIIFCMIFSCMFPGCQAEKQKEAQKISIEDCVIVYDSEDYMSRRYAHRVYETVRELTKIELKCFDKNSEDIEGIKITVTENDAQVAPGKAKIAVGSKEIKCVVGSYYGFEAVLQYISSIYDEKEGLYFETGEVWNGDYADYLTNIEASNAYAYTKSGDYRVMFYNVLWESQSQMGNEDKPGERNYLQARMIEEYMPDVIGVEERNKSKTDEAGDMNLNLLLALLGYEEVDVEVKNAILTNCTPIYYNPEAMTPLESGYLNYKNQSSSAGTTDKASKSITWAVFETNLNEKVIVAATHMCTQDDAIGAKQAKEALEILDGLVAKYNAPVVLGGDFNAYTNEECYKYYTEKGGYEEVIAKCSEFASYLKAHHRYPMFLGFRDMPEFSRMYPITSGIVEDNSGSVDHILVNKSESFDLKVFGVVVDDLTLSASDHFPIFVDFSIN